MRLWLASMSVVLAVMSAAQAQQNKVFRLVAKISVPTMTGTWDHLAADASTKRLFLSAQDDNAVQVIDLAAEKPLHTITGGFDRPQGIFYITDVAALAVSNGRDGTLRAFDGNTYQPIQTIHLSLGADMMDYDPLTKLLYVDHGGIDSNRGPGGMAIIDVTKWKQVGNIPTEYRPGAVELDHAHHLLYVTLPGLNQVGVIDIATRKIVRRYDAHRPGKPISLALDTARHRLFVGTRTPDHFMVFDTDTGKVVSTLEGIGGIEGMYFDAAHKKIYTTGLDGIVEVYQQLDPDHYKSIATFPIVPKAGTSIFIPQLNRFCVAAPPYDGHAAQVWVFQPLP